MWENQWNAKKLSRTDRMLRISLPLSSERMSRFDICREIKWNRRKKEEKETKPDPKITFFVAPFPSIPTPNKEYSKKRRRDEDKEDVDDDDDERMRKRRNKTKCRRRSTIINPMSGLLENPSNREKSKSRKKLAKRGASRNMKNKPDWIGQRVAALMFLFVLVARLDISISFFASPSPLSPQRNTICFCCTFVTDNSFCVPGKRNGLQVQKTGREGVTDD